MKSFVRTRAVAITVVLLTSSLAYGQSRVFQIEEMTINGLHRAIQNGETVRTSIADSSESRGFPRLQLSERL